MKKYPTQKIGESTFVNQKYHQTGQIGQLIGTDSTLNQVIGQYKPITDHRSKFDLNDLSSKIAPIENSFPLDSAIVTQLLRNN